MLADDYPFLDILWTMLIFFAWIIWFWLLITVFADIFRRHEPRLAKVLWIIFVIVLPFLGVFIYLIVNHDGMAERTMNRRGPTVADGRVHPKTAAAGGGAAAEIEKAKGLLDSGAITQAEFDAIKAEGARSVVAPQGRQEGASDGRDRPRGLRGDRVSRK